jgi:ribonuclease E
MRPSLQSATYLACRHCGGTGVIKSHESLAIELIRILHLSASKEHIKRIELFVSPEVSDYLQNTKRAAISQVEHLNDKRVIIHAASNYAGEKHELVCYDQRGSVVKLSKA